MSKSNGGGSLDVGGSLDRSRVASIPNPEVAPKERRWRFSAAYKLRIVEEAAHFRSRGRSGRYSANRRLAAVSTSSATLGWNGKQ